MSDLTAHQRDILIAMLQGKRIELDQYTGEPESNERGWVTATIEDLNFHLFDHPEYLRVTPNQPKAVRLYELPTQRTESFRCYTAFKDERSVEYIDITENLIIGGKL